MTARPTPMVSVVFVVSMMTMVMMILMTVVVMMMIIVVSVSVVLRRRLSVRVVPVSHSLLLLVLIFPVLLDLVLQHVRTYCTCYASCSRCKKSSTQFVSTKRTSSSSKYCSSEAFFTFYDLAAFIILDLTWNFVTTFIVAYLS